MSVWIEAAKFQKQYRQRLQRFFVEKNIFNWLKPNKLS